MKNGEKILRKIIDDLYELLADDGHWVDNVEKQQAYGLDFKCTGKLVRLRIPKEKAFEISDADIWLSLDKLSNEEIMHLTQRGIAWFDIKTKRTGAIKAKCWKYMRDFLFRYGLRFRVLD